MSGDNLTQVRYYLIEFYIHTSKNNNLEKNAIGKYNIQQYFSGPLYWVISRLYNKTIWFAFILQCRC